MRGLKALGADGAFNGLPLWQTPTYENSTNYYKDLGEAVADMPILVYANMRFFKMKFLADWWELLAKRANTVIAAKISYSMDHLVDDVKAAGHKIRFIPNTGGSVHAYEMVGDNIKAIWSTTATCGPEPSVALANAILARDVDKMKAIDADFKVTIPHIPPDDRPGFDNYNSQSNKWITNLCGWMKGGPLLAPYNDLPEKWIKQSEMSAPTLIALRKKYLAVAAK
jgi:dihydrodipicolinate synthase/N-acetylneuraminate lyase